MAVSCTECGAATTWDDDAASAICTSCGTLTDPSQSILTDTFTWNSAPSTTSKSHHSANYLAGQGKEARDEKNNYAMASFIRSMAHSINAPGLVDRTTTLFHQAMSAGKFRWGRRAKLIAGACLAAALRESKRPDSLRDIAFLLTEPLPTLVRTLSTIITILHLSLTPSDPTVHLPSLQSHLSSLLQSPDNLDIPANLITQLLSICIRSATHTATALATLLARRGPDHRLNQLSSPPTSCALFLLALEAQSRTPLNPLGSFAACLGARVHVACSTVMTRYKLVQDEIATWIEHVPWLHKYERTKGRAKLSKRAVVARGLADVIQFQEDIWKEIVKPDVVLDTSDAENEDDKDIDIIPQVDATSSESCLYEPNKRQRSKHDSLRNATQFLLNPLAAPIPPAATTIPTTRSAPHQHAGHEIQPLSPPNSPPTYGRSTPPITTPASTTAPPRTQLLQPQSNRDLPLISYILSAPAHRFLSLRPPTRLELLSASKGGEQMITDDELFAPGELDALVRGDDEVEELKERFGWGDWGEDCEEKPNEETGRKRKRRKGRTQEGGEEEPTTSKKINLDALAKFLNSPTVGVDDEDEKDEEGYDHDYDTAFWGLEQGDEDEMDGQFDDIDDGSSGMKVNVDNYGKPQPTPVINTDEVLLVDEWRPLSPEDRCHGTTLQSHYDEEYD